MRCASSHLIALGAAALLAACASGPAKQPARSPRPAATPAPVPAAASAPATKAPASAPVAPSKTPAARRAPAEKVDENSPYGQALKQLKSNQLPDAEAALQAVAKANPQASGPHTNLGIVYVRTKRLPEARAAFARAVAINPGNAVAHNWLGVLAREAGDYARAEQAYRAAVAADAGYAPALLNLAILYDLHLKRPAAALEAYRQYEQATDRKDTRAAVWIAEIEATAAAAQAPKSAPEPARPAAGKPMGGVSQ